MTPCSHFLNILEKSLKTLVSDISDWELTKHYWKMWMLMSNVHISKISMSPPSAHSELETQATDCAVTVSFIQEN